MLHAATRLLQTRGYYGTGLNDILAESGAPRGSLYFHFPDGKGQLALEATRAAVDDVTLATARIIAEAETPGAALRTISERIAELMRCTNYERSCPISPLIHDGTNDLPALLDVCREAFDTWMGLMEEMLLKSGLPADRAKALSLLAQTVFQGGAIVSRTHHDDRMLLDAIDEVARLVDKEVADVS
ncbi:TetR/AcrR family transcriptional regulator [Nordella sp. HKS 07]|uniref:TetR/AcrR family transcriptional regulator n=1 Tax=Nordella sp. HKS 07 TaxID=2712222 RepID=UPI0013E13047|nr:TetR/AcrR family transcriptional regulator [Nordella sp. HKS 07]QIG50459.1 TetR/AcrR family transcriptional regulator [Nordella sp. HKS 07]